MPPNAVSLELSVMEMVFAKMLRWVSIDGHDRIRWQSNKKLTKPYIYRLYVCDVDGKIDNQEKPLLELEAPEWRVDIEVVDGWYDCHLTVRVFNGTEEIDVSSTPHAIWIPARDSVCRVSSTEAPPWQSTLSDEKLNSIIQSDYYKNWLETTTDRCTDISKLESDNHNFAQWPLKWRTDGRILFHGDEEQRPPEEIFKTGLTPPEPYGVLRMRPGVHVSALECFSYSFNLTVGFEAGIFVEGVPESRLGYIYLVDAPGGLLVDRSIGEGVNAGEQEVDFMGGLQARWIVGAFTFEGSLGSNAKFKSYQDNPQYKGNIPPSIAGMTRIVISCWDPDAQLSLHTTGKFNTAYLNNHGVGFVEEGKPFTVKVHDADGACINVQWRINQEIIPRGRSHAILIRDPKTIDGTQTVLIEAGRVLREDPSNYYIKPIIGLNALLRATTLDTGILPPEIISVSHEINGSDVKYQFNLQSLSANNNIKELEIWEVNSIDGENLRLSCYSAPLAGGSFTLPADRISGLSAADLDASRYYFHYFVSRCRMSDETYSRLSAPAHSTLKS